MVVTPRSRFAPSPLGRVQPEQQPVVQRFTQPAQLPVCTENPLCVRLQMTATIAAALARMNEPRRHSRPAA